MDTKELTFLGGVFIPSQKGVPGSAYLLQTEWSQCQPQKRQKCNGGGQQLGFLLGKHLGVCLKRWTIITGMYAYAKNQHIDHLRWGLCWKNCNMEILRHSWILTFRTCHLFRALQFPIHQKRKKASDITIYTFSFSVYKSLWMLIVMSLCFFLLFYDISFHLSWTHRYTDATIHLL